MFAKLLSGSFLAVLLLNTATAAPPSKTVEEVLSWVPHDAALFFHADVAALWISGIRGEEAE